MTDNLLNLLLNYGLHIDDVYVSVVKTKCRCSKQLKIILS